jgi:hypothetical protein
MFEPHGLIVQHPCVLISLTDAMQVLREAIVDFRNKNRHQADYNYPIWRDGGFDTIRFFQLIVRSALVGDSFPVDAMQVLENAGMDYNLAKDVTVTLVDLIQGNIIDHFPNYSIEQMSKFHFGIMPHGDMHIFPNGIPPVAKGVNNAGSDFTL